jgi:PST family polysaccharide transporter
MTSIRKSLASGIFYTAIAKYSGIVISVLLGAVLARILTPAEFGTVALVMVFAGFFSLLSNFGIGPAVVQHSSLSREDISSIFLFSIFLGVFFALVFFLTAAFIADFYDKPELINITRLLSVSILFNSIQVVPQALLRKALKFKQIGIVTICCQMFSGFVAVALSLKGFSYYALIIQSILSAVISCLIFYCMAPITRFTSIRWTSVKKIIRFSSFDLMFNFINYFSRNSDNLLIGKYFGSVSLGFYDKSYKLMMMPVQNLTFVITPVLMPVLSKFQDDKNVVYNTYLRVVKSLAIIGFPLSVFLFFSANEIIHILYGPGWSDSVPIFRLLALTIGLQIILSSSGSIFQAINRTDLYFYSGALSAVLMIGGILYGIFFNKTLIGIGYGLFVAFIMNFVQCFYILISLSLRKSLLSFYKCLFFPFIISVSIAITLNLFIQFYPEQKTLAFFSKLFIAGFTFAIIYLIPKENRHSLKNILDTILMKSYRS